MSVLGGVIAICLWIQAANADGCASCVDSHTVSSTYTVKMYHESHEHVENPHRGFLGHTETKASHHSPLTKSLLDHLRSNNGVTLVLRVFVLDSFVSSSISTDFLNKIRHDLDVVDSAGFTAVLRFCYTLTLRQPPPYGDASKSMVLRHISQLKPIFHQYERVITSIEAGFIGTWGEWYYTDHFGMANFDAPGHDPATGLSSQALRDRKDVVLALLHAAPKSIQIQLRTPQQKMHAIGTVPAKRQDMQSGNDNARSGHHNDCFLASDTDYGTYSDKAVEYPYLASDTRYCIMGGETCGVTTNHRHECPTATKELAMFHWTYLNQDYNGDVLNVWKNQGCYEDVHRRLGYRLTIQKAILPKTARVDDNLCFHLEFKNTGYAAPVKHLKFYFILESSHGSQHAAQVTDVDVRDWQPGYTHTVSSNVQLTHFSEGHYKVFVALSDPLMGDRADYNVLLATTGVPLYTQGLNDLGHTVFVSGHHTASTHCTSMPYWTPPTHGHNSRVFKGSFR
ncbi:uncharacterized protein [Littorina saxatilis]|uniref:DUF4832 domain-containing protein n=1 Tax=Littorina saxatilis TaxID=31220 RepID=A0AAN9GP23_9CAEN